MQINVRAEDGTVGITTVDEGTLHLSWPCVPHLAGETCDQAMARARKMMGTGNTTERIFVPGSRR